MAGSALSLWQQLLFAFSLNMVLLLRRPDAVCEARLDLGPLTSLAMSICSNATFPTTEQWGTTVPYATSLAQLKSMLTSSASSRLYYSTSAGSGNATVYGTYQRRGDLNSTECSTCISMAAESSASECPQAVNARIELDACSFYYQNVSILPDLTVLGAFQNGATNDSTVFLDARPRLLQNVSAAAPYALNFYSSATSDDAAVFAVAQCFGYLTPTECAECVGKAAQSIDDLNFGNQTGGRVLYGSCMHRFESALFFNPTPTLVPTPAPATNPGPTGTTSTPAPTSTPATNPGPTGTSSSGDSSSRQSKKGLVIGLAVGGSLLILALCGLLLHRRWAKNAYKRGEEYIELQDCLQQHQIRFFSPQQLKEATKNFQQSSKLGEGGFGSVFKGTLQDGQVIAIKKLTHSSHHGRRQFLAEVESITRVQHRNLIRLLGCCLDGADRYLIYEFLANESLDKHIFEVEGKRTSTLPWCTRQKIILGTAKGLMYLHHESNVRIIHRDIKAANILLDQDMEPKIADFGLAKLLASDQTHLSTALAGTIGYLAPEYTMQGQLTEKSDTYSFGLVVLEILSGRRVIDGRLPLEQQGLLKWAWVLYEEGRPADVMDPLLKGEYTEEEVRRAMQLALLCTQTMAELRPTMAKVVAYLEGEAEMIDAPRKPELATQMHLALLGLKSTSEATVSQPSTTSSASSTSNLIRQISAGSTLPR